jgi:hypothetical protein
LQELAQAEKELIDAMELVESTAIGFGAALQVLQREMRDAFAEDEESLVQIETTCKLLLELPKSAIQYAKIASEQFGSVANTVRRLCDTIETLTENTP